MRTADLALLLLCSTAFTATAGPIADTFSAGIYGVPWGAPAEELVRTHPGGDWVTRGGVRFYSVRDGREVLGIQRSPKDRITFRLSQGGGLVAATTVFPDGGSTYAALLERLRDRFGPATEADRNESDSTVPNRTLEASWPADQGITVELQNNLVLLSSETVLTVTASPVNPAAPTGFE